MRHSNKISIPLRRASRELRMISHGSIPKGGNAIQPWKSCLKGTFPTPHVVPKTNFGAVTHLESRTFGKLFPPPPNEFPETQHIRPKYFIRAPPTSLTAIFNSHYLSPESPSLSRRHNVLCHNHFPRRAQLNMIKLRTPKPPLEIGEHTLGQLFSLCIDLGFVFPSCLFGILNEICLTAPQPNFPWELFYESKWRSFGELLL